METNWKDFLGPLIALKLIGLGVILLILQASWVRWQKARRGQGRG